MTYCTNCGTAQEPNHRFCAGCAEPVGAAPATPIGILEQGEDDDWATDPPARRRGALVIALIALVLLLGGIGVAAWSILAQGTDTAALPPLSLTPPPSPSPAGTSTSQAAAPSPAVDPEDAALDQLTQQIAFDRSEVQSELAEAWVPQLSSKQLDFVVDGVPFGYTDILEDHLSLRAAHDARLVWSSDWSSFREKDFYVTVAAVPFSTPEEANAWCDGQAIDADNCFAKRLSTIAGPDGSIVER